MNRTKRLIVLLLAFALLLPMGVLAEAPPADATPEDLVTLRVMSGTTAVGYQENHYLADMWAKELSVAVETFENMNEKLQPLLASGDLCDITVFRNYEDYTTAIKAGLLLNLDEYKNQLPNVFANSEIPLQYLRDNVSNDTGNAYGVGFHYTNKDQTHGDPNNTINVRWDYYKELGYPQVETIEGLLDIAEEMLALHPTNDNGKRNYALSLWPDWDTTISFAGHVTRPWLGYSEGMYGFLEVNNATRELTNVFDDDSVLMRSLALYNDAYRRGLLDPDSMTQTWTDYWEKMSEGRIFVTYWPWGADGFNTPEKADAGVGYRALFTDDYVCNMHGAAARYVGEAGMVWTIAANSQHLEEALAFTDWNYSYDGVWRMYNGPQGIVWDVDENGEPYVTEQGWDIIAQGGDMPGGGNLHMAGSIINACGPFYPMVSPEYGRQINRADWIKKDYAPGVSALDQDWQTHYDAESVLEYVANHEIGAPAAYATMPTTPDDILQIESMIGEVVKPLSWKMIYAKDDDEYAALKAEMVEKAYGLGLETVNTYYTEAYQKAVELGAKYAK